MKGLGEKARFLAAVFVAWVVLVGAWCIVALVVDLYYEDGDDLGSDE